MKTIILAAAISLCAGSAFAASCKVRATESKLAGAAMTSFMKKCQTDAEAKCDKAAGEQKLSGAAKNSFTKKCVTDEVGS